MKLIKQQENNVTYVSVQIGDRIVNICGLEKVGDKYRAIFTYSKQYVISSKSENDAVIYMANYAVVEDRMTTEEYVELHDILFSQDPVSVV